MPLCGTRTSRIVSGDAFSNDPCFRAKPFDIPYRSLVAKDVDGLMMAGRCISGDFYAHSAYRVTGNAVGMGQAAGWAAATAVKDGKLPHEIDWSELAKTAPWNESV